MGILHAARPQLEALSEEEAKHPIAPGKWSRIQLLGHLIDSAANNHQRFVRIQQQDAMVFEGYQQEAWVEQQDYQSAEWKELIALWFAYNQHLARIIDLIPVLVLVKRYKSHNLHQVAWQTVPADEAVSMDYFIRDYMGHMEHHLSQMLPGFKPQIIGTYTT